MADDEELLPPQIRLMNFVSETQLEEARRTRGPRVEDGTAQRDRPLFEILQENKDKKDAEFNERFKHRPPKALDEDETEFLDKIELSKREYERQMADEEDQQLRSFQAAVASQSAVVHELKETSPVPKDKDKDSVLGRKNPPPSRSVGMLIKVKPQAKKAKVDTKEHVKLVVDSGREIPSVDAPKAVAISVSGLVSYSDESEDDE